MKDKLDGIINSDKTIRNLLGGGYSHYKTADQLLIIKIYSQ